MSQPCSAVELVLFDGRELSITRTREALEVVTSLGILSGVVLDHDDVATVVERSGTAESLGFWFGSAGGWPFERAISFVNVEPGRALFVSADPHARQTAEQSGLQTYDPTSGPIEPRLP